MRALLLCLPLCLLMAPDRLPPERAPDRPVLHDVADKGTTLPDEAAMVRLAQTDPVAFLEWCNIRYDREVTSYRLNFKKQERLDGKLKPSEDILVDFKEKPFSVLFTYVKPDRMKRVLYIKPDNFEKDKGKILVQTAGPASLLVSMVERDPDGIDAKQGGRYPIYEFGLKIGSLRTLESWIDARKDDALHVEFLGEKKIKELNGRTCWVLKRTRYHKAEDDGIMDLTIYVDKETWLQTGSVLKNKEGGLIAEYLFRDVEINPKFEDGLFTRKTLQMK